MAELDHIVVTAATLEEGVAYVETALGVKMTGGGAHVGLGTHNRLLSLGADTYLEVIAPNPDDAAPLKPRMFDLDRNTGKAKLTNWVLSSKNASHEMTRAPKGMGVLTPLSRGDFRWSMTMPPKGVLPYANAFPAIIQWQSAHPAPLLSVSNCRLQKLEIWHPYAREMALSLAHLLSDDRVVLHSGAEIVFQAEIMTPGGIKILQ